MKACCGGTLTPVLALVGLVGLGVGGYAVLGGECGSCKDVAPTTAVITPAATTDTPCCGGASEADVKTVNVAIETKTECCSGEAKTEECSAEKKDGCCSESKSECTEEKTVEKTEETTQTADAKKPA